jgi:hypothetical protein
LIKVLEKQHENPEDDSSGFSRIIIEEKKKGYFFNILAAVLVSGRLVEIAG